MLGARRAVACRSSCAGSAAIVGSGLEPQREIASASRTRRLLPHEQRLLGVFSAVGLPAALRCSCAFSLRYDARSWRASLVALLFSDCFVADSLFVVIVLVVIDVFKGRARDYTERRALPLGKQMQARVVSVTLAIARQLNCAQQVVAKDCSLQSRLPPLLGLCLVARSRRFVTRKGDSAWMREQVLHFGHDSVKSSLSLRFAEQVVDHALRFRLIILSGVGVGCPDWRLRYS